MNFISAEEFLKQPKKVQDVLKEWWQPQVGDLVHDKINIVGVIVPVLCIGDYKSNLDKNKGIPLLTEGQLRQFIEDKTNRYIETSSKIKCGGYKVWLHEVDYTGECTGNFIFYENLGQDILQAYWKVACKVAKEV